MHPHNRIAAAVALIGVWSAVVAADVWQGRAVVELLEALNERGHQIIYSSDVVAADLLIVTEPDFSDPFAGLANTLLPHGLLLDHGPAGTWLVKRADRPETAARPARPAPLPLPEIVVTTSLHRLEYSETGTQTYLDRELATRIPAAAEETTRITNRLPGIAGGGISARSHIRGGEVNEVLFLLDGLRLYEPFHLKDFQSVASVVNSSAIDGIDFYSGAYPARYGDRMSGVMNISLREPVEAMETELAVSFFNASALSMGYFGDEQKGDWLVAARRGNLDLIADVVNPDIGNPDYQDYIMHVGWNFGPRLQLSANALYSRDKLALADPDRGETANAAYDNEVLWFKWQAEWSSAWRSETILSLSAISDQRFGTLDTPDVVNGVLDDIREFDAVGLKQDWTWLVSEDWMLSFGVEGKHQDARYQFFSTRQIVSPFDGILQNRPTETRDFDVTAEGAQYNAYAEARWRPRPSLTIDAGFRWDYQDYTSVNNDEQFSPRASVLYQPSENWEFRVGWGQYSQAQEINELQVSDGVDRFFPAQRAEHLVLKVQYRNAGDIELSASYFRKSFRDVRPRFENAFNVLTFLPELQFDRYRIDPQSARARGAELMISRGEGDAKYLWWLGYAWAEVQDEFADGKVRRSWDQTHALKAGTSWRWGMWNFSAAGEVHTGWPKTELIPGTRMNPGGSTSLTLDVSEINSSRYSGFSSLDVRVSRDFRLRRSELTAFFEISNVSNRDNDCCTEYRTRPGSGGQELIAEQGHWLPLVPSLGVIWRF